MNPPPVCPSLAYSGVTTALRERRMIRYAGSAAGGGGGQSAGFFAGGAWANALPRDNARRETAQAANNPDADLWTISASRHLLGDLYKLQASLFSSTRQSSHLGRFCRESREWRLGCILPAWPLSPTRAVRLGTWFDKQHEHHGKQRGA